MTQPAQPARPAKFNFDTVFGTKGAPAAGTSRSRSVYSAEEVDAIRNEAFAQGKTAAAAESTHAQTLALSAISQSLSVLISEFDGAINTIRGESAKLALTVAKKLAEIALQACPQQEVEAFIGDCMHKLHQEPRLVMRVSPQLADAIKAKIEPLSDQHGFTGRVIVLPEPSINAFACRIEWADGGVEQDLNETFSKIQEHVARWQAATQSSESGT